MKAFQEKVLKAEVVSYLFQYAQNLPLRYKHTIKNTWVIPVSLHSAFIWTQDCTGIVSSQSWGVGKHKLCEFQSGGSQHSGAGLTAALIAPFHLHFQAPSALCSARKRGNSGTKKLRIRVCPCTSAELSWTSPSGSWKWKLPSGIKINTFCLG